MFTHLHLHTQYSLLEGAIKIPELTSALQQKGFDACAITDHGNMYGAMEFYHAMKKAGLKPLIGMGIFSPETEQENGRFRASRRPPQTQLICLNREGYRSLTYLSHHAFSEGKQQGIPCVDQSALEQYHHGLIAFSGGLEGVISQPLLQGRKEEARKLAGWYRDLFDGRFYLELQDNGLERQQELNRMLVELAEEMELPLIASNDCFYLESREAEAQHILWLMGMQSRVTDEG
ncbi:MAG: PHP domain-containing protein, partial [SAR324 cluster bacterium]|nr:PHP domain-containing protein [SAR324 cluster bacterium]